MKSKTENSSLDFETENIKNSFSLNFMKSMFNLVGIELICTPAAVCVSYINILEVLNKVFDTKIKPPIC